LGGDVLFDDGGGDGGGGVILLIIIWGLVPLRRIKTTCSYRIFHWHCKHMSIHVFYNFFSTLDLISFLIILYTIIYHMKYRV
jgi:hypothetical protein